MDPNELNLNPSEMPNAAERNLLEADRARGMLFDELLEQLALCDLFSNPARAPTIFPVYAHDNDSAGVAHAGLVHQLIEWLQIIKARILSDKGALPPLVSNKENTSAQRNILSNQIRLLPIGKNADSKENNDTIDKVIVFASDVLKRYCDEDVARGYITRIRDLCYANDGKSMAYIEDVIRKEINSEVEIEGFHHVLTELAFLEVRKSRLSGDHGMIPVALNGDHRLPYLPFFGSTDLTLKLESPTSLAGLHRLFFKLLEQLFVEEKDFVSECKKCYDEVVQELSLEDGTSLSKATFDNCLSPKITNMYHKYWDVFSTAIHNGKYVAYTGKIGKHTFQIWEETLADKRQKILQWVSGTHISDSHGIYGDGNKKRISGTCDWVIHGQGFHDWHTSEKSEIFLLSGSMGTGKTYATSRVIDWVEKSLEGSAYDESFASFYCIKQDNERNNPKAMLRSIVKQIASGPWNRRGDNVALDEAVIDIWEKHSNDQLQFRNTFSEWGECLLKLVLKYPRTTIVIDALDECVKCDEDTRKDLVGLFTTLTSGDKGLVKIFCSTRPELDLSRFLNDYPGISTNGDHNQKDIAIFVRDKLEENRHWFKHDYKEKVVSTLVERSRDMFLFASLQIDRLLECEFEEDMEERLRDLPQSLTEAYKNIYTEAITDREGKRKSGTKRFLDRALRWVLWSARPLTTDDLLLAISQDSRSDIVAPQHPQLTEDWISARCRNLLTLDPGGYSDDDEVFFRDDGEVYFRDEGEVLFREDGEVYFGDEDEDLFRDEGEVFFRDEGEVFFREDGEALFHDYGEIYFHDDCRPVWRLAHQAVAEFIERGAESIGKGPSFFGEDTNFSPEYSHYEAGKVCLMVLIDLFGGSPSEVAVGSYDGRGHSEDLICPCQDSTLGSDEIWRHKRLKKPLAQYAIMAWPTHVRAYERCEFTSTDKLSQPLKRFLCGQGEIGLAYERWLEHASSIFGRFTQSHKNYRVPPWSVFATRLLPNYPYHSRIMSPIHLACHLGFRTILREWLHSSGSEQNSCYESWSWLPMDNGNVHHTSTMSLKWSLVALACAHDEVGILELVLDRVPQINTTDESEVPPIVATAIGDSAQAAEVLLERCSDLNSAFTRKHGHVLIFAIHSDSLNIMRLLLDKVLSKPREVEEILASVHYMDFKSPDALIMLLEQGVDVNTSLKTGTPLMGAASHGWEALVRLLLERGADVNKQFPDLYVGNALHSCVLGSETLSMPRLLIQHGARVGGRTVSSALTDNCRLGRGCHELSCLLFESDPDLDETWLDHSYRGGDTPVTALIEQVKYGNVENVQLLIRYGADVNLRVGGKYDDALNTVFLALLERKGSKWDGLEEYPTDRMIKALLEAGASLEDRAGDSLNTPLAGAAYCGMEEMVQNFLDRGADPNAFCKHKYVTALAAAVASEHPQALYFARILLENGANVNLYIPEPIRDRWSSSRFALDFPLSLIIAPLDDLDIHLTADRIQRMNVALELASYLVSKGAIWDIDFEQWRTCCEMRDPGFYRENTEFFNQIMEGLRRNRVIFFQDNPGAASDERWMIKVADDTNKWGRNVFYCIHKILN